ncbi:pneumococcal surface A domain protein [Streptococcus pneumoniae GA41538]|nr:pneumococcal surface A domain protein [Streptococcus pneumoniae GA41538]
MRKKIDEAQEKLTKAKNEFQSVRAMVVPEPEQLAETKKKAEEAKAEEAVAKEKSDKAAKEVEVAKKE